ncbi:hypothetical protein CTI14_40590, partial [Methylobacterium radiotolerans]
MAVGRPHRRGGARGPPGRGGARRPCGAARRRAFDRHRAARNDAAGQVFRNGLDLLGVSAPEAHGREPHRATTNSTLPYPKPSDRAPDAPSGPGPGGRPERCRSSTASVAVGRPHRRGGARGPP